MPKSHITKHSIEMYLCGNLKKEKLEQMKEKFKKNLLNEQKDLRSCRSEEDEYICQEQYITYLEQNIKNKEILIALKKIFPRDSELNKLEIK